MASGKTTLGKGLANRLNREFIDLDEFIVKSENKTITELFDKIGEIGFRKIEHKYLLVIAQKSDCIIALGGGTPCFYSNMDIINSNGLSIYLKVPASEIQQRLHKNKKKRPIIAGKDEYELFEFMQQQIGEREKYYLKADKIFTAKSIDELCVFIDAEK